MTQILLYGDRLKELREKKGLSQEEVGKALGVSKVSVCGYELGKRNPSLEMVLVLADYYGVDINYILGRDYTTQEGKSINKEDLEIIEELKMHSDLYCFIRKSIKRNISYISQKINIR